MVRPCLPALLDCTARTTMRALCALALLAATATMASATVINFAALQPYNSYAFIPNAVGSSGNPVIANDYGSTAQVTVGYRTFNNDASKTTFSSRLQLWNTGYSNLPAVVFSEGNGRGAEITLTPTTGFAVTLQSFQLGSYPASNGVGPNLTVPLLQVIDTATSAVVWSDNGRVVNTTQSLAPNVSSSSGLILQWGYNWNIGLNNLMFDAAPVGTTVVPVPPAIALFVGGLGLMGWVSRRRAV